MKTKLFLIRHGQTASNAEGRLQGWLDVPLSEIGILQAEAVAKKLTDIGIDIIYSSDLKRAYQTAEHIARHSGQPLIADSRLREWNIGLMQGQTLAEVQTKCPAAYAIFTTRDPEQPLPEGESRQQHADRVLPAIEEIAERHPGKRIVIVSHGGVLNIFFRHVLKIPIRADVKFLRDNAAINVFDRKEKGWTLCAWGDTSHYPSITPESIPLHIQKAMAAF